MIVLHHLNQSRSQRVLWLLEELGLPYEIRFYERNATTMLAPPELKQVHPLGKSPVITDADAGLTLAESGAILEYLVQRYGEGRFRPVPGSPDAVRYLYFMHYAEGSVMPPLLLKLIFDRIKQARMPFFAKPIARGIAQRTLDGFVLPQVKTHLDYLESELSERPWFTGEEFTVADVQLSFPIEAARARGGLNQSRPRLMDFLERIHQRPAYQRALERGGKFSILE
ncbi:MAG: glutathione S-transferase [Ramlibacter sp.]|nr:glutathione S-transferase [Ramlibacter sp.]